MKTSSKYFRLTCGGEDTRAWLNAALPHTPQGANNISPAAFCTRLACGACISELPHRSHNSNNTSQGSMDKGCRCKVPTHIRHPNDGLPDTVIGSLQALSFSCFRVAAAGGGGADMCCCGMITVYERVLVHVPASLLGHCTAACKTLSVHVVSVRLHLPLQAPALRTATYWWPQTGVQQQVKHTSVNTISLTVRTQPHVLLVV